jgi:hypothetical protein
MNLIRLLVLLVAGGIISLCGSYAQAQGEIDPDHYETPAHKVELPKTAHSKSSANHSHQYRTVAAKHSGTRTHHHHSHASA